MTRFRVLVLASILALGGWVSSATGAQPVSANPAAGQAPNPRVMIETNKGNITLELFPRKAPASVKNFLGHVKSRFYDGTVFHRVIPGFMIQGGGMTVDLSEKPRSTPIRNEAGNGLRNLRGTVAMARTADPHSATTQFFINVADNPMLDHRDESIDGWGYAVFGKVVSGMEVVDAIAAVPRGSRGPYDDVPVDPVVIKRVSMVR